MNTKRKGLLQKVLMLVLVLCLVCGNGLMALANEAVASSMRLTKTEGTVSVTNKNGHTNYIIKSSENKRKPPEILRNQAVNGGDYRTRTCDLLRVKHRKIKKHLKIFEVFGDKCE